MSETYATLFAGQQGDFAQRLAELRARIAQLPAERRAALHAAADAAERQHRRMQANCRELLRLLEELPERVARAGRPEAAS